MAYQIESGNHRRHCIVVHLEADRPISRSAAEEWLDKNLPNLPALETTDVGQLPNGGKIVEVTYEHKITLW